LPADKKALYEMLPKRFTTGEGLIVAEGLGIIERTYKNFIKETALFEKLSYGNFEKIL